MVRLMNGVGRCTVGVGDFSRTGAWEAAVVSEFATPGVRLLRYQGAVLQDLGTLPYPLLPNGSPRPVVPVRIRASKAGAGASDLFVGSRWSTSFAPPMSSELTRYTLQADGGLGATGVSAISNDPADIEVADFNGDGKSDVVVVSEVGRTIDLLIAR